MQINFDYTQFPESSDLDTSVHSGIYLYCKQQCKILTNPGLDSTLTYNLLSTDANQQPNSP